MKLSARNQLKGTILSVQEGAVNAIVVVDIGGGNKITASITKALSRTWGLPRARRPTPSSRPPWS